MPTETVRFDLEPVAASRPRVAKFGTYYAEPYKSYKKALAGLFQKWWGSREAVAKRCSLLINVVALAPKKTSVGYPRPDVDNYAKSVMDAMNGSVLVDDKQITKLEVTKEYGPTPYLEVTLKY